MWFCYCFQRELKGDELMRDEQPESPFLVWIQGTNIPTLGMWSRASGKKHLNHLASVAHPRQLSSTLWEPKASQAARGSSAGYAGTVTKPENPLFPGISWQIRQRESRPECLNCSAFLCFWKAKLKSIFYCKPPVHTWCRHFLQHRTSLSRTFLHCNFPPISTEKCFCHVGALAVWGSYNNTVSKCDCLSFNLLIQP